MYVFAVTARLRWPTKADLELAEELDRRLRLMYPEAEPEPTQPDGFLHYTYDHDLAQLVLVGKEGDDGS